MPRSVVQNVLTELPAELCHAGLNKLELEEGTRFRWPYQDRDILEFSKICEQRSSFKCPNITRCA